MAEVPRTQREDWSDWAPIGYGSCEVQNAKIVLNFKRGPKEIAQVESSTSRLQVQGVLQVTAHSLWPHVKVMKFLGKKNEKREANKQKSS